MSKRIAAHLRRYLCCASVVLMCIPALGTSAKAAPASANLQSQRDAFRAAYAAARSGKDWRALARKLKAYPLYPYLEAAALQHDIQTAPVARIDAYLKRYTGMIPAQDVREAELRWRASQKDWKTFRHFYRPGLGDGLACAALQAKLAEGGKLDFATDLAALWQKTRLPAACKPVLAAAASQGLLTPQRVWARIERAADAGDTDAITQAAQWLDGNAAVEAQRIADALRDPTKLLKQAKHFSDTPYNREAVARALRRLARRDIQQAIADWQALSRQFGFDQARRNGILASLALYNAVDGGPDAVARLAALPAAAQTDATREWRVRAAVAGGDWKAAQAAIDALTPEEMEHDEWRYWKARIAEKLGNTSAALDGFSQLARQATFYGFLAADRAGLPYSICPATVPRDAALDRTVEHIPGIDRAFEFFALDMLPQARREWNRAFGDLSDAQQRQAAALASQRGWYDRAIFAFGRSGDLHYYALRFPLADRQRVLKAARSAGIDPAWTFAIIRAETAWQTDAQSGANARGLMQLLPATASQVARRSGLPYHGPASLYDPAINIPLGAQYLAHLAQGFDGSPWLASAAYNAGPGNARRWVAARGGLDPETFIFTIPFNETRDYVTRVLSFATIYGWRLYGEPVPVSARLPTIGTAYDPPVHAARKPVACRAAAPATPAAASTASAVPARSSPP